MSWTLFILRLTSAMESVARVSLSVLGKVAHGILNAFEQRNYYFLHGYSVPFHKKNVNIYASSSAQVEFAYNADIKQFSSSFGKPKNLPILSLEIVRDNHVLYDLTEFIESMTIVSDNEYPNISQIIQAWSLDSQIVLDRTCDFIARVVSCNGQTHDIKVTDTTDIDDVLFALENPESS